jgi:hypothetical protein
LSAFTVNTSSRLESFDLKAIQSMISTTHPGDAPQSPNLDGLSNFQGELVVNAGQVKKFSASVQASQVAIALVGQRLMGNMHFKLDTNQDIKNPGHLAISEGTLKLSNVQLQKGKDEKNWYKDTEITVAVLDSSFVDINAQKAEIDFLVNVSKSKVVIALIPGGLPRAFVDLVLSDTAPATAKGKLSATSDQASIQNLEAEAGGLKLGGSFIFSPKLKGSLTATYLTNAMEIQVGVKDPS